MNFFNLINKKTLGFSILIIHTILFLCLLLFPASFTGYLKITIIIISLITLVSILRKQNLFTYFINHDSSLSESQNLYKKNSELMNQFLDFKDLEVHHLEAEISRKDTLYKKLFDFAPDAFIIFDKKDDIVYFNAAFTNLVDNSDQTDFLSRGVWDFIHPDSMTTAQTAYSALLAKAVDVNIIDIKIVSLNGVTKKVRVSSSVTFFEDEHYIFSCFHDLSTHYEQERIKMELENNIANEKFKVEFFANISHDIKTPVNVIYSAVQLQDMYLLSNEYDQVLVYNNIIKQNCLRLQKLLNDILDITKLDADCFTPKLNLTNIICSLEYITQSVTSYLGGNQISIIFDTNVEDKLVMTDISFIERIMLNLISNAIKYGKQNGHVWVTLHDEGNHLIISVKDDGIGIPKSQITKIFKRFHQTNQTSSNTASSNGIGLSLVQSMVKSLDGSIFCLSTEGVGTEFVMILPMESLEPTEDYYCEYATSLDLTSNLNIELSDL